MNRSSQRYDAGICGSDVHYMKVRLLLGEMSTSRSSPEDAGSFCCLSSVIRTVYTTFILRDRSASQIAFSSNI